MRLEIVGRDEWAERVVGLIQETAHTGLRGEGKIFVSEIQSAGRISTREQDEIVV